MSLKYCTKIVLVLLIKKTIVKRNWIATRNVTVREHIERTVILHFQSLILIHDVSDVGLLLTNF